jgi:hypothetical protein
MTIAPVLSAAMPRRPVGWRPHPAVERLAAFGFSGMALAVPIPSQPYGIAEPDSRRPDGRRAIAVVFLGMTMSDEAALRPLCSFRYLARFGNG